MSKRSTKTGTRPPSVGGKKSVASKTLEECSQCSKPSKSMKKLPCNHSFCSDCVKTLVKKTEQEDGRASKMSKTGSKKNAAPPPPKDEYECPICNVPPPEPVENKYGDCAPCK